MCSDCRRILAQVRPLPILIGEPNRLINSTRQLRTILPTGLYRDGSELRISVGAVNKVHSRSCGFDNRDSHENPIASQNRFASYSAGHVARTFDPRFLRITSFIIVRPIPVRLRSVNTMISRIVTTPSLRLWKRHMPPSIKSNSPREADSSRATRIITNPQGFPAPIT